MQLAKDSERAYRFAIVSYIDKQYLDALFQLLTLRNLSHYSYIVHDKDKTDVHIHLALCFSEKVSVASIRRTFVEAQKMSGVETVQNTFIQLLKNVHSLLDYFSHTGDYSDDDKFCYDPGDIVYDDQKFWGRLLDVAGQADNDTNTEFVTDLLSQDYDPVNMAKKYGRDYIKNISSYEHFRNKILYEKSRY